MKVEFNKNGVWFISNTGKPVTFAPRGAGVNGKDIVIDSIHEQLIRIESEREIILKEDLKDDSVEALKAKAALLLGGGDRDRDREGRVRNVIEDESVCPVCGSDLNDDGSCSDVGNNNCQYLKGV